LNQSVVEKFLLFAKLGTLADLCRSVPSFQGLPTIQFLITCSMQKWRGAAWFILSCEWRQCLPR